MPVVTAEHVFDVCADELWALIGDFGDTGKWSGRPPEGCVQEGEGIGALRTLALADGRQIVDRLEAQTAKIYSYSVVSSLLPCKSYRATMVVEPIDAGSSRFTWTGEFEPLRMSDKETIALTKNVYAMGVGLMQKTLAGRGKA